MIYVSTGAFKTPDVGAILDACVEHGIHRLELSSGTRFVDGMLGPVRRRHGRPLTYLVHNYFPPHARPFVLNLAALDDTARARSLEHCRAAIDLAAELGSPFYSVHAGSAMNARPEELGKPLAHRAHREVDRAYAAFVENVKGLAEHAGRKGLKLLVENHVVAPFNLIDGQNRFLFASAAEEMLRFVDDVRSEHLGLLLDVGHLNVTAASLGFDRLKCIEAVAPHVKAFHLSENDGTADQNLAVRPDSWFLGVLRDFRDTIAVIESYRLEPAEIHACVAAVERALGQ